MHIYIQFNYIFICIFITIYLYFHFSRHLVWTYLELRSFERTARSQRYSAVSSDPNLFVLIVGKWQCTSNITDPYVHLPLMMMNKFISIYKKNFNLSICPKKIPDTNFSFFHVFMIYLHLCHHFHHFCIYLQFYLFQYFIFIIVSLFFVYFSLPSTSLSPTASVGYS